MEMKWSRHQRNISYLMTTVEHLKGTLEHLIDMLEFGNQDGAHAEAIKAVKAAIAAVEVAGDKIIEEVKD